MTNALSFNGMELITTVKSFVVQGPREIRFVRSGNNTVKLFMAVIYEFSQYARVFVLRLWSLTTKLTFCY